MFRFRASLTVAVVVCALLSLAAAAAQKDKPGVEAANSAEAVDEASRPVPMTALQLPSESLMRAARALADNMPSSLNLPSGVVQTLAVAGAVVVGLVGATAVLSLVLPMFGFRLCYLFGTCDSYAHAYLAPTAYDAYAYSQPVYASAAYAAKSYDGSTNELPYSYDGYPQHSAQVAYPTTNSVAANAYQKRSLEYVGPILKMLSNAYEKYNHHPSHSKSIEETPSTAEADPKPH